MKQRTKLDLGEFLPYLVNRAGMIIAERFSIETLAPHQLSIVMWRVMAVLASNGSQRQIDLAELTSIDASTLSRIVTRLARIGLLTRKRSTTSSREVVVMLSAKGDALVTRLIPQAYEIEAVAADGLSPVELAVVKRCLRRIYSNMKSEPAAARKSRQKPVAV
jgi:MarR family transcriptional regulator, organic hydroperoxide resistance regulator